jgi:hypothetical protein
MFESTSSGLKSEMRCAVDVGKNSYKCTVLKFDVSGNESLHQPEEAEINLVFVELNSHKWLI